MAGADHRTVAVSPMMRREGGFTSAAILTVGMVVQEASTGKLAASAVASTIYEGGEAVVMEAPERGKGIYSSGTTENTYAVDEEIPVCLPRRGEKILLLLTSGQVVARAGYLEIASTGKAIAHAGTNLAYARALEALSPSQDALILARKL